jgi:translocator protein
MTAAATTAGSGVEPSWRRRGLRLFACLGASFAPGIFGSRFEPGAWYQTIEKSALTPPGWVFPIVWPALYLMMGFALWRYLETAPRRDRTAGISLFGMQLVLNGLWSFLFFGLHRPGTALVEIGLLWLAIVAVIVVFQRHSRGAAALLAPYLAWVSFAAFLNFEVWRLQ